MRIIVIALNARPVGIAFATVRLVDRSIERSFNIGSTHTVASETHLCALIEGGKL